MTAPHRCCSLALCLASLAALAEEPSPIQDNSFLVEEAYNQEAGVIQHVSLWSIDPSSGAWDYSLTEEWPLFGIRNQVGGTLSLVRPPGERVGLGDLLLNYRLQALGDGAAVVAMSPRVSLVLPTGRAETGHGGGRFGLELNLPLSWQLSDRFVTHWNAGLADLALTGDAPGFGRVAYTAGASFIWLTLPSLNLMLEAVYANEWGGEGLPRQNRLDVGLGARKAFDFDFGLQVVAGAAAFVDVLATPLGVAPYLYLSFEH